MLTFNAGTGSTVSGGSTVTISNINTTTVARYRSAAFTPSGTQNAYISSITNSAGGTTTIKAARIVIVQTDPNAIDNSVTQIEIGDAETTTSTSDTVLTFPKYWTYDGTKYDGSVTAYLEATMSNNTAGDSTTVTLYQSGASCSTSVSGSAVTMTGTIPSRIRSNAISANLSNGTTYMVCVKASAGTASILNAKLIIQQTSTGLSKMEIQDMYINTVTSTISSTYVPQGFLNQYNPSDWAAGTFTYMFGGVLSSAVGGATYAQLYNGTDNTAVTNSEVSAGSGVNLVASSSLTMPIAAKDMDTQIMYSGSHTGRVYGSWLIIDVSSLQTPENLLPFLPLALFIPALMVWFENWRKKRKQ